MGFAPRTVLLSTLAEQEIVKSGQHINGLVCTRVPSGVEYFIRLGNNPWTGPYLGIVTWTFGSGVPITDVREGVFFRVAVPVPNGTATFQVSFK